MSGREHVDRAKKKPGDLRAEMAERVGLTVDNQNTLRREGFASAVRSLRSQPCKAHIQSAWHLEGVARKRWGSDWEPKG